MNQTGRILFVYLLLLLASSQLLAQFDSLGGLKFSVSGDLVAQINTDGQYSVVPREGEILIYSPADYLFNGQLSVAAGVEHGKAEIGLHELFLGSTKLIPRSRLKLGQYFLGVGRLNQIHRHDWPFTEAPTVQDRFFGEEGLLDTGAEYSFLAPLPFYLDLTVGIASGYTFGHTHDLGEQPKIPTHYARASFYNSLFAHGGLMTGLNYIGRTAKEEPFTYLLGADITAKWRTAEYLLFLLQSEVWYREGAGDENEMERSVGAYLFPQYGFSSRWQLGVRLDGFSEALQNFDYGIWPTVTFMPSEFVGFRGSYGFKNEADGDTRNLSHTFMLQVLFFLGEHPAHEF